MEQPDEPLHISAPIAWEMAPRLCYRDPATGENCAWNHGFWQILRMMGLAGSAAHRGPLYRRVINSVAAKRAAPRILISGSADYAMLAQILPAAHEANTSSSITVVDICETPLYLNQWYADRENAKIDTCRSDILAFDAPERFDMICADYILGRLPPGLWPALILRWKSLLKPGGTVVTACRLRPHDAPERVGFSAQQIANLKSTGREWTRTAGAQFAVDADAIDRAVERYAARNMTYSVRSADGIRQHFEAAGLVIDELVVNEGESAFVDAGPSVAWRPAGYMHIIARRS